LPSWAAERRPRRAGALAALAFVTILGAATAPARAYAASSPPDVALVPPAAWTADPSFRGPDLAQTPQLTETRWTAWRRAGSEERLVVGCFRAPVGAWSPEIAPIAMDRIAALAASTALRIDPGASLAGGPLEGDGVAIAQSLAGDRTRARTWLAFTGGPSQSGAPYAAHGCMAVCARGDCDDAVAQARLTGTLAPPPQASRGLRALLALVHHPRATALGGVALACVAGAIALATRRRPRGRGLPRRGEPARAPTNAER
jgi:hypothetical protein